MIWVNLLRLTQLVVLMIIVFLSPLSLCQNTVKGFLETLLNYIPPQQQRHTGLPNSMMKNLTKSLGTLKSDNFTKKCNNQSQFVNNNHHYIGDQSFKENVQSNLESLRNSQSESFVLAPEESSKLEQNLLRLHSDLNQNKTMINNYYNNDLINSYNYLRFFNNLNKSLTNESFNKNNGIMGGKYLNGSIHNLMEIAPYLADKSNKLEKFNEISVYKTSLSFFNDETSVKTTISKCTKDLNSRLEFRNASSANFKIIENNNFLINKSRQSVLNNYLGIVPLDYAARVTTYQKHSIHRPSIFNSILSEFINKIPIYSNLSQRGVTQVHLVVNSSNGAPLTLSHELIEEVNNGSIFKNEFYETQPTNLISGLPPGLPSECYTSRMQHSSSCISSSTERNCTQESTFFRRVHHHPEDDESMMKTVISTANGSINTEQSGSEMVTLPKEEMKSSFAVDKDSQMNNITQATLSQNPFSSTCSPDVSDNQILSNTVSTPCLDGSSETGADVHTKLEATDAQSALIPEVSTISNGQSIVSMQNTQSVAEQSSVPTETVSSTSYYATICRTIHNSLSEAYRMGMSAPALYKSNETEILRASLPPDALRNGTTPESVIGKYLFYFTSTTFPQRLPSGAALSTKWVLGSHLPNVSMMRGHEHFPRTSAAVVIVKTPLLKRKDSTSASLTRSHSTTLADILPEVEISGESLVVTSVDPIKDIVLGINNLSNNYFSTFIKNYLHDTVNYTLLSEQLDYQTNKTVTEFNEVESRILESDGHVNYYLNKSYHGDQSTIVSRQNISTNNNN